MLCLMLKVWTIKLFFLSWWILSLTFFSSKVSYVSLFLFHFPKNTTEGSGGWGLEVTVGSNLEGATCKGGGGGLVDPAGSVCFFFLIKPS